MNFSEFAKRLYPVIGRGAAIHAFSRTLFETIVDDDGLNELNELGADVFKSYYSGNTSIRKLSQRILGHTAQDDFVSYINDFSEAASDTLYDAFSDVLPEECNISNIGYYLSNLFMDIIKEAASAKRATPVKKAAPNTGSNTQTDRDVIAGNIGNALLMFAEKSDAIIHEAAEQARENKQKTDSPEDESEAADAEVIEDGIPSDTDGKKVTVIRQQTNVIQNGDHNVNVTNNGTMNFNF